MTTKKQEQIRDAHLALLSSAFKLIEDAEKAKQHRDELLRLLAERRTKKPKRAEPRR